jgi:DNA-binding NtrC family response regulator
MSWLTKLLHSETDRIQVLAVMPDTMDRGALEGIAGRARWDLRFSPGCDDAIAMLQRHAANVIICDRDQSGHDWREALRRLAAQSPACPILVSAPDNDDRFWLEVMERGGYDVVTRPFVESRLVSTVLRAASEVTK